METNNLTNMETKHLTSKEIEAVEKAAEFWAEYFNSTKDVALGCHHMTIDCMVQFAKLFANSNGCKNAPILKKDLDDELCNYCLRGETREEAGKKGAYGVPGGFCAGCEGSDCDLAYEMYLEQFNLKACKEQNSAIELISDERKRQIEVEGWTTEHDDKHTMGELAQAASCYALPGELRLYVPDAPENWPWNRSWWKPANCEFDTDENYIKERIIELKKAGALIVAEIERLQRIQSSEKQILANSSKTCKQ